MLRELKNHNPKHDLEYMLENCGNLLHAFVDSLDIESICIEHSEKNL